MWGCGMGVVVFCLPTPNILLQILNGCHPPTSHPLHLPHMKVYFGDWAGAVPFFSANGYDCPAYINPSDYFLHLLRDKTCAEGLADAFAKQREAGEAADPEMGNGSVVVGGGGGGGSARHGASFGTLATLRALSGAFVSGGKGRGGKNASALAAAENPWYFQVVVLMGRMAKQWLRNPMMLSAELFQYIFFAVFIGG